MKGRNTAILSVRVSDELRRQVQARAKRRQKTVSEWLLWAVNDGLRDRHRARNGKADS